MARQPPTQQADLLEWTPPEPVVRFEPRVVQAATLASKIAKAIGQSLRDHPQTRPQVAAEMSRFLGREVRASSLDTYASEAKADHVINVVLFMALLHATGDRRLLEMLAADMGWAVIERRWLRLIDLAALQEKEAELRSQSSALRRLARAEGTL